MKPTLALACFLALPIIGQTQMPMPMPGMPEHPKAVQTAPKSAAAPTGTTLSKNPQSAPPEHSAMPFGKVADGDTSLAARPVPATPTPLVLDATVQEQEHPGRRTGSAETLMPDVLAEVKERAPESLQFFAERAAANNPTLRVAEAQVRRLRAEAKQAGLWQNPEIGYEADHVRGGIYAGGEQGGYVQQVIPLAGQRSAARGAVEAQATAAEAVLAEQRQRVQSAVEQAFYAALAMQREVELRGEVAELAADATAALHQFANIGQADAPDVLQSEVEREQARLELASAQRAYLKDFTTLAAVSGDATIPATLLAGDLANVPVLDSASALGAADTSPALRAARQQASSGDAAVRSARKQALPQLTLRGGLQQDNEPLESTRGRVGVVGIAQAGITLPLWNRNQGAVEAARAQQAGAQADVARTQLSLRMQAAQALQDYANAMRQVQRYRDELLPRARRAAELYQQKYAAMASAYPQSLASQKVLLQLEIESTHALATAWQNAVLLQNGLLQDGLASPGVVRAQASSTAQD